MKYGVDLDIFTFKKYSLLMPKKKYAFYFDHLIIISRNTFPPFL